jgi:hypothetical protein
MNDAAVAQRVAVYLENQGPDLPVVYRDAVCEALTRMLCRLEGRWPPRRARRRTSRVQSRNQTMNESTLPFHIRLAGAVFDHVIFDGDSILGTSIGTDNLGLAYVGESRIYTDDFDAMLVLVDCGLIEVTTVTTERIQQVLECGP